MIDQLDKTIEFYVKRIVSGKTTVEKLPTAIKDRVVEVLRDIYAGQNE